MFQQILDLVGQPPGSLVYHFIILFAVEAAFAISIGQWMRERHPGTLRLTVAIFGIFLARVAVLLASLAAWQGYVAPNTLLPPVERLVDTITVIALGWAFVTMDDPQILRRNFIVDVVAAMLLGVALIGFAGTIYYWSFGATGEQLFNSSWIDSAWAAAQIALAVVYLAWMLTRIRYMYDPFLKGIMLVLLAAAAAVQLVRPVLGDVAAAMRVGQIVVMPMLAAIAFRHVVEQLLHWDEFEPSRLTETAVAVAAPAAAPASAPPPPAQETVPAQPSAPPAEAPPDAREETVHAPEPPPADVPVTLPTILEIVDAIGGLLSTLEPSDIVREVPRAVATALRADICVLAIVDETVQQADIVGAYDNISQTALPAATLDLADHPTFVNALGRLRQMRLTSQRNHRELLDLYNRVQVTHEGPTYIQPLVNGEERIGALIVGSPYSERQLSNEERNLLDRLGPLVTAALLNAESYRDAHEEASQASVEEATHLAMLADDLTARTAELNSAQRQIDEMKAYIRDLHRQLEEVPQQQAVAREQMENLVAEIKRLRADNESVRQQAEQADARAAAAPDHGALQKQLDEARQSAQVEIAALRARLTQAAVSQQEATFLQEQFAIKAREAAQLQTRLIESQAVVEALREQIGSGLSSTRELGTLQNRVAAQAAEIAALQADLADAQAAVQLDPDSARAQQEMEQIDREAVAQLEAQLAERMALVAALETQLNEKTRAVVELKSHMSEVNISLRGLEDQLTHKTDEISALQDSLARTRHEAQERITELEAHLARGESDVTEVDRARVAKLEAELAERAAAVETLESQLQRTTQSMGDLERQLNATNQAVDAAISEARQGDSHDEVIASIAQELRTPMSSIMGYTELLLRESVGILGSLQRKFLQRVKANTERMGALLDDLIRITALDTGRMQLEPETIDVLFAVEEVVMNVSNQYNEKGLVLRMALPDELPPVIADQEALTEIIEHLLSNAALASPVEGEVRLTITTRADTVPGPDGDVNANCIAVSVADSGVGVSPDDYERVFLRKYRADNPLIDGLGDTGVGLSLTKALVDAHGGRIWLESYQDGQKAGTTFHVVLPIEPVAPLGTLRQGDGS